MSGQSHLCKAVAGAWPTLPPESQIHYWWVVDSTRATDSINYFHRQNSKCSYVVEGFHFDGLKILSMLFLDDVVLLASSGSFIINNNKN